MRQNADDRRAGALRAERRERLRVPALEERRDREQLGGRDDALAAAPVDANLEHADIVDRDPPRIRALTGCPSVLARTARSAMLHLE